MKQTDIQSFYRLQMPRWLFFDKKYIPLSLEAKVTYTFLLNRFQLSRLNNWINRDGAVFIIYTRQSLASEMQISYRCVIDCMKELSAANLIWERRCGRGDANQIYLEQVELTNEADSVYKSVPFVGPEDEAADSRPAETACLGDPSELQAPDAMQTNSSAAGTGSSGMPAKTCENGTLRRAESAYQDLQNPHASYIDNSNIIDLSDIDNQSVRPPRARHGPDRQTQDDLAQIDSILSGCELHTFSPETAKVFENAIERLFFSESYRIGNSILPRQLVRAHLRQLDCEKLQTSETKISRNTEKTIRNTTAYTMAVIFNSICETESDLMNDPYLNSLRNMPPPDKPMERRDL